MSRGRCYKMKANLKNLKNFYDKETSKKILSVIEETDKEALSSYESVKKLVNQCYNPPSLFNCRLVALNELLGGCGIEYVPNYDEGFPDIGGIDYVNMGDSYIMTIIYDHEREEFIISSYGDYLEENMKRFFGWK